MGQERIRYLEMIEKIIERMGNNSFNLKEWTIILVTATLALNKKTAGEFYFLLAYIPIIFFWGLDAYYLMMERKYRKLYEKVCASEVISSCFSLDVSSDEYRTEKEGYFKCLFSKTEVIFYFPIIVLTQLLINSIWI